MIEEVSRVTEDEKITETSKILTAWNPLGQRAAAVKDLDNYQTEAIDILSVVELQAYSPKRAVSEVLQQAFLLDLEKTELDHFNRKIKAVLEKE